MKTVNVTQANTLSLDNICTVFNERSSNDTDDIGNPVTQKTDIKKLFCAERSVHSNEFYKAKQSGIQPEKEIIVDTESYGAQRYAEYGGTVYRIYRTYPRADGLTELYLTAEVGR